MNTPALRFVTLAAVLAAVLSARADVVLDNLVHQDDPDYSLGNVVGQALAIGDRPISLASVRFSQAAVDSVTGPTGPTSGQSFAVWSRNADGTYGAPLFSDFGLSFDAASGISTATARSPFTLQPNASYFLTLVSPDSRPVYWDYTPDTSYASAYGVSIPTTSAAFTRTYAGVATYYDLADGPQTIQVNGTVRATPEPSALAALAVGATALLRRRCRPRA